MKWITASGISLSSLVDLPLRIASLVKPQEEWFQLAAATHSILERHEPQLTLCSEFCEHA